ncbi:uncharacterized protein [Aegilops tauschii subsp. strangulata]|uniref:uncharacterized protein n=1 Tax=Aegilops tauschii subsp. strangulata TaxID=200361 RepID=UPI003CC898A3
MVSKKFPQSKAGFFGMRAKSSRHFGVEFSAAGRRLWLNTYPTADKAVRAYNMAAEQELWWKRDVEQKKKEDETGPSTVIPVEFDSSDWGDSEEDDEGCDDPNKDEFREQFKSFDEE